MRGWLLRARPGTGGSCGHPDGFEVNLAYVNGGTGQALAVAVQQALARVGITVNPKPGPAYYCNICSTRNAVASKLGVAIVGWAPDFPTPYGLWFALAHGDANQTTSDDNYPDLDDPHINELIDRSLQVRQEQWPSLERQLDDALMDAAVFVPLDLLKDCLLAGGTPDQRLLDPFFGLYDVVNLGVSDGR